MTVREDGGSWDISIEVDPETVTPWALELCLLLLGRATAVPITDRDSPHGQHPFTFWLRLGQADTDPIARIVDGSLVLDLDSEILEHLLRQALGYRERQRQWQEDHLRDVPITGARRGEYMSLIINYRTVWPKHRGRKKGRP